MTNSFYSPTGNPGSSSPGNSAPIRNEFAAISAGFDLLPTLAGNASRALLINSGGTGITLTTGQLALAGNFSLFGAFNLNLLQGASVELTLPLANGTLMTFGGGTMTGALTLASDPSTALMAATKQYVDGHAPLGGPYLPLAGGTVTGSLAVTGALSAAGAASVGTTFFVAGATTLNSTLNVAGVARVGDFYSNGAIRLAVSGGYFFSDASFTYLNMDAGNWRWQYNRATGTIQYIRGYDGAALFTIDPGGNASVPGAFTASASLNTSGGVNASAGTVTGANFMSEQGTYYVAGNFNYYVGRNGSDGAWRFVENGTVNSTLGTNGSLLLRGPSLSLMDGDFGLFAPGARTLQFAAGWPLVWDNASGSLNYFTSGGGPQFGTDIGTGNTTSFRGPMQGNGAYVNISDERLKQDIAPATIGLAEILMIEPINFTRVPQIPDPAMMSGPGVAASLSEVGSSQQTIDTAPLAIATPEVGFSAQQLQTALPDAVRVAGILLSDGTGGADGPNPTLGVTDTTILVAAVNAIKTLNSRLIAVEAKVH